jgi:hypothetical protein
VLDLPGTTFFANQEITPMKNLLVLIVVVVIAGVGIAFWRGWFTFETKKEDGKVHIDLTVNKEKFKQDKEKLKETATAKSKEMKDKLASLRDKSKGLSGQEKAKADKEIEELSKKHESLDAKIKELENAGEDKFEQLKKSIEEDHPGTGK